jgi:hypothetical protein
MLNKRSHHPAALLPVWYVLGALLLAACHVPVRNNLVLPAAAPFPDAGARLDRRIGWLPLIDARPDDARAVGQIGLDTYAAASVDLWVADALHGLSKASFKAVSAEQPTAEFCIRPKLVRLYLQDVDITKSAHIVLDLEFFPPGKPSFTKLYRGRHTAMNWWGTNGEMSRALNLALKNCLQQISADLATGS